MTLISRGRVGALALTAAAVLAGTVAMPAQATAPTYAAGDAVTVDGLTVTAPTTAGAVALSVDRADGSSQTLLVTTNADGSVTVVDTRDAVVLAGPAASPSKCNDSAFTTLNGSSWPGTYRWYFRKGTTPNELSKAGATNALTDSVNNITKSSNGCGLDDQVSATASYKGSTTQASDVTSQPACKASPGSKNVTEFGPIGGGGILAATCTYSTGAGGDIVFADVRINTGFEWWTGGGCSGAYGVRAVQTHEYGHAFGLGHVSEADHGNLTMSTNINSACSNFEASLGRGDVLGLRSLY